MHIFWIRMISQKPDSIESNTNSVAGLYEEKKNEWDATKQIEMFKIQRICIDVAQPIRNIFKSAERPKIGLNLNSEVEPLLMYVFCCCCHCCCFIDILLHHLLPSCTAADNKSQPRDFFSLYTSELTNSNKI